MNAVYPEIKKEYHDANIMESLNEYIKYNTEYMRSVCTERRKEYHDTTIIKYVHKLIQKREASWIVYLWEKRRGEMIIWQHPFH